MNTGSGSVRETLMMKQTQNLRAIISQVVPEDRKPMLTEAQLEKLKAAGAITLFVIGVAGVITLSAIAPNIFWAINKIFFKKSKHRRYTKKEKVKKITRTIYYLKERGYIKMRWTGKDFKIFLTGLGKKKLAKMDFLNLQVGRSPSWDQKWWQVAADIPTEDYKWAADLFREKLMEMKFFPLQRTLWFYPYDPRKEVEFLTVHYGIGKFVTVMEINRLDRDDEKRMKRFFEKERII